METLSKTPIKHVDWDEYTEFLLEGMETDENMSKDFSYAKQQPCDVVLVLDGLYVTAHKFVLAAQSNYFNRFFFGRFKESNENQIALPNVNKHAFSYLMQNIYEKDSCLPSSMEVDVILDALEHSRRFEFRAIEMSLRFYLAGIVDAQNVLTIFSKSKLLGCDELTAKCLEMVEKNSTEIFDSTDFVQLQYDWLLEILWNKGNIEEADAIERVGKWLVFHTDTVSTVELAGCFDISKLTADEIMYIAFPSMIFDAKTLMEHLYYMNGITVEMIYGLEVENRFLTSTGDKYVYGEDVSTKYGRKYALMLDLKRNYEINHVEMKMIYNRGYILELSTKRQNWKRIIDSTGSFSFGRQDLYFDDTVARYVKISVLDRPILAVNSFKVYKAREIPRMMNGFICPTSNVVVEGKAIIFENPGKQRADIIEKFEDKGLRTPYYSGNLDIRLCQPFVINCIRVYVWDFDKEYDEEDHVMAVTTQLGDAPVVLYEALEPPVNGLQVIRFPCHALQKFRIVGEANLKTAFIEALCIPE